MTMTCLVGRRSASAGGISVMAPTLCRGQTLGPVGCLAQSGTNSRKSRGRNSRFGGDVDAPPFRMGRHARTDWIRKGRRRRRLRSSRVEPAASGPRLLGVGRRVTGVGRHRRYQTRGLPLRVAGAMLLAVSAGIHLDLYVTGYRSIPTIGWLFLLQFIGGLTLAVAVLVTHSRLAVAASAAFALSTLSAYLLAVWIGLFGFKEVRTRAGIAAGLIEVAAFALLALAAITADPVHQADGPVSRGARMLARAQAAMSMVVGAVGTV